MGMSNVSYFKYIKSMLTWSLLGTVAGGIAGFGFAFCFDLFSCGWNIFTCHWFRGGMSGVNYINWLKLGALIGVFIGFVLGYFIEKNEEVENKKQIQKCADDMVELSRAGAKEAFGSWTADLRTSATDLVLSVQHKSKDQARDNLERFIAFKTQASEYDVKPPLEIDAEEYKGRYGKNYETALEWVFNRLTEQLSAFANSPLNHHVDDTALDGIEICIYVISQLDSRVDGGHHSKDMSPQIYTTTLQLVQKANSLLKYGMIAISFNGYGIVSFGNDDPRAWTPEKADSEYEEYCRCLKRLDSKALAQDYINGISALSAEFFTMLAKLMWHYADATPFNVERFDQVRDTYNAFTAHVGYVASARENVCFGNAEEVLARIYAKNKMGSASTVAQEEPYFFAWLEDRIEQGDFESCYRLVSGLAWLGLFDLELRALRIFVDKKVQMTEELQNRLGVLESGRTLSVRVFDVESTSDFAFDSSSTEWSTKDFSFFFRSIAVKKTELAYSLALTKWTKALPLQRGLKVSSDEIFEAFEDLTLDYDGEVSCERVAATAVDHTGLKYEDAILFRFSSERSRCVSILFTCEKFGRNLNVTIYTLFTPESGLPLSDLESYAMAAKTNMYMDTFRESILQSLDDVLKVEKSIYGDDGLEPDSPAPTRNVIA